MAMTAAMAAELFPNLPRSGKKLTSGAPYTILAVGDSVTATGNYHEILAKKLADASGNRKIRAVKKAHGGCSADATSRNYATDVAPVKPDLLLILYGLNDQACFAEPDTFLENYRFIADRAVREFGCDVLFLEPPPHPELKGIAPDDPYPWRTGVFAAALERHAAPYPAIPVFAAFGRQPEAKNFVELFRSMHRLYPARDHIHPNAAGHARLAETVFDFLQNRTVQPPLEFRGRFCWGNPPAVELTVRNRSDRERSGELTIFAPEPMRYRTQFRYRLAPGETETATLPFPELKTAAQLLEPPWSWYLKRDHLAVTVVDFGPDGARVAPVPCPRPEAERGIPEWGDLPPLSGDSGRIPLIHDKKARELFYTRYGAVLPGEAAADGDPAEWTHAVWSKIGAPHQARALSGARDNRRSPDDKRIEFSARAGAEKLHLAFRIQGKIAGRESFTLYFDPRDPAERNTVGTYYWLNVTFRSDGKLNWSSGETADRKFRIEAARRGNFVELSIPCRWFGRETFPASGDLGFSVVWFHAPGTPEATRLTWSESGHAWTPRNYGVLRRIKTPDEAASLPYRIRIE